VRGRERWKIRERITRKGNGNENDGISDNGISDDGISDDMTGEDEDGVGCECRRCGRNRKWGDQKTCLRVRRMGFVGICGMIVGNEFRSMSEFSGGQPGVLFVGAFIARPMYEIEELTSTLFVDL